MNLIITTAIELGLLYSFVALALFISYRILDIADLTTDGCFVLGGAVSVMVTLIGHPFLGLIMGMVAGSLAGLITAFLQTKCGVSSILSGIVTNMGLYTINLAVMGGKSNVSLLRKVTVFTLMRDLLRNSYYKIAVAILFVLIVTVFLFFFVRTNLGLSIRATGNNKTMVKASSIDTSLMITIGLMLSNSLTALSGGLVAQYQSTIDINAGTGIVVTGLACLIIGETVLGRASVNKSLIGAIAGSLVYRFIYALALYTNFIPVQGLKLLTAVIVALAIAAPTIKEKIAFEKKKRGYKSC